MEEKKKNSKVSIVAIMAMLALIAGGVYYYISNNVQNNQLNTNELSNGVVEKFTLTKEEYPKIDGATAMRPVGIGRDGFVFVVNKENSVDSLTIEEIQKIYTGKITNWKEVGGEDKKILAYQREKNSGSQNLMEKMVMKDMEMIEVKSDLYIDSMSGLMDAVASYENSKASIGYSIYLYAKDSIKFLSINGVYPTDDTIADGSYPLSKIVYAIYRKDEPQDSNVRKLVEWLKTEEGQKAVEAGGYVGLK